MYKQIRLTGSIKICNSVARTHYHSTRKLWAFLYNTCCVVSEYAGIVDNTKGFMRKVHNRDWEHWAKAIICRHNRHNENIVLYSSLR